MTRYSVIPGPHDQFLRTSNYVVVDLRYGPLAICQCEADAKKVATALNQFDGEKVGAPPAPDPEEALCPRGGDHLPDSYGVCAKCGVLP